MKCENAVFVGVYETQRLCNTLSHPISLDCSDAAIRLLADEPKASLNSDVRAVGRPVVFH